MRELLIHHFTRENSPWGKLKFAKVIDNVKIEIIVLVRHIIYGVLCISHYDLQSLLHLIITEQVCELCVMIVLAF